MEPLRTNFHKLNEQSLSLLLSLLGESIDKGQIGPKRAGILIDDLGLVKKPTHTLSSMIARLTAVRDRVHDFVVLDGNGDQINQGFLDISSTSLTAQELTDKLRTQITTVGNYQGEFKVQLNEESPLVRTIESRERGDN